MAGTLEIPSVGEKNTTADPKVKTGLETFNNLLEGSNKIPGTSLAAAAAIADTQLASPNNGIYKTLFTADGFLSNLTGAGVWLLGSKIDAGGSYMAKNEAALVLETTASARPPAMLSFAKADYEVAGKTQKLRLRGMVGTNGTAPAVTLTFGLYPVTIAGGTNQITYKVGTVTTGSTFAIATPPKEAFTREVGADFTIPADGAFLLGVSIGGTIAANSAVTCHCHLQSRNV